MTVGRSGLWGLRARLEALLASGSSEQRRPLLGKGNESTVKSLYVIGDLAGAPVIKLAMAQGVEVIEHLRALPEMKRRADAHGGAGSAAGTAAGSAAAGSAATGSAATRGTAAPTAPAPAPASDLLDVLVIGAGAAGLNAALAAQEAGFSCVVLEKERIANTIEDFPEGKWVYAEPDSTPPRGKLWLDGARKEGLVERWRTIVAENHLDVRVQEPLETLAKQRDGTFVARTPRGTYRARKVVLATGQRGNPRRLGVPGEDREQVYHRLYAPRHYRDEDILVVGGGNSAIEAALTLAESNRVVISYRRGEFSRLFRDNQRKLEQAVAAGRLRVVYNSTVREFREGEAVLEVAGGGARRSATAPGGARAAGSATNRTGAPPEQTVRADHAFVLIGAELPVGFLRRLGIRLENDWSGRLWAPVLLLLAALAGVWLAGGRAGAVLGLDLGAAAARAGGGVLAAAALAGLVAAGSRGNRWAWLALSFFVWYSVYGIKYGKGEEFWPYRGWGYAALSFLHRPWAFWYTVLYTALLTLFGLQALKRWGLDRRDRFQIWRYASLLSFQWIFFFIVPEFLFRWAVEYQWVGARLASDPQFADQAWRAYGIVYAWPLFFYTFFYDPHMVWVVWGVLLSFVVIPVLVLFHGKRYCSWICGCGGLAETFGDRWRHLAPKGRTAARWERMNLVVLVAAAVITVLMLARDAYAMLFGAAEHGIALYRLVADVWLVGILPVTLYPFLGGKVWCRYWCPLAKMMQLISKAVTRRGWSRFHIYANDKCIACGECTRYCQVGIPVMQYALTQEVLDNGTSSCIGCGICVTVCPMDTLSFGRRPAAVLLASDGR